MDFTNFDFDQFFGFGEETNPLMMLLWLIPIFIFVFYGQRIQLQITSKEIKKNIVKLKLYKEESREHVHDFIKNNLKPESDPSSKIDTFLNYFTIMPVDMDPSGIVPKVRHLVRSREDYTREQVRSLSPKINEYDIAKTQTLLEIATSLQLFYKIVNHLFLTAKKQNNYPLILPLQMILPFIMEEAEALKEAMTAFTKGQPIGDGFGPMVVGKMMLSTKKQEISFQTVYSEKDFEERKLLLLKANGPLSTVGRLGDAVELIVTKNNIDSIIMVDAALKLEGEDSAEIAQGFGAAIGGIGAERFVIEEVATKHKIPIFAMVIKESVKEAITLMSKEISEKAEEVHERIHKMIQENTKPGQLILVIGVGNTIGVSQ